MSESAVVVTEVGSEDEAAMVCGFLESAGIDAIYRPAMSSLSSGIFGMGGTRHEVLVGEADLDAARTALAERTAES